jgi:hypothetical protein
MDVTKVEMDPAAADKAFREYRAAFMADRNKIDGELMRGYKALADGKTLISLTEAINKGGLDIGGRPALAIARADESQITMIVHADGRIVYDPWLSGVRASDRILEVPSTTLDVPANQRNRHHRALIPFIPPQFRPPHALTGYHILWEALWHSRPIGDPMLLKRIGGDVFAVVAAWDLTPLEKLVLAR